jgi:ADP-ribose pyrophosphatase YjhB (NUDIX family)
MPTAVSKRQFRFMQAILHGKPKPHPRGTPPKSIAGKYSSPGSNAPEQSGSNTGGTWGSKAHAKAKKKIEEKRTERKKKKAKLRKAFSDFYKGRGAGCVVVDPNGKILVGKRSDDKLWTTPGGHVEPMEDYDQGALRELREEAGIVGHDPIELTAGNHKGNSTKQFLVESYKGKLKSNGELTNLKFMDVNELPFDRMRQESKDGIGAYLKNRLTMKKSLKSLVAVENLEKNIDRSIARGRGEAVFEMTHGDATRLIGNGAFRFVRAAVKGMTDEDFKDVKIDNYTISIRKHSNDIYSGRVNDGHKIVHQFTNKSLPQLTAELMSVFEWYLPEDEPELMVMEDSELSDDAIHGGLQELIDNYKKHNIANIYDEMENIREEIRHGNAVDLQQIEKRIMKLFDKLETCVHEIADKHNQLLGEVGTDLDTLEEKLQQLQYKIDELGKKPSTVEAFSSNPAQPKELLDTDYCYLSKPCIEISPNGKIKITFSQDWNPMDQENFLKDMRAKVINNAGKKKK